MPTGESELHPLALQGLSLVEVKNPGQSSAIPEKKLEAYRKKVSTHTDDKTLFVHLCVLYVRLRGKGLLEAAEQFKALASLGLKSAELAQTVERADKLRDASKSLDAPVQHNAAAGLRESRRMGVSLRGGPKKSTPKK